MIELYILACLVSAPSSCKDVSLVYLADAVTPQQCLARSQAEIVKWAEGQPKWFAKRWGCRTAGQVAKI